MNNTTSDNKYIMPELPDIREILNKARKIFYKDPNVIGIGFGPRRVNNNIKRNEYALLVYVAQKLPKIDVDPAYIIPEDFMGLTTDVIEPLSYFSSITAVDYKIYHHISDDLRNIDWGRLGELHMRTEYHAETAIAKVGDFGDVCVVEDDGTFIRINDKGQPYVWYPEAFRLFRILHGDDYDFVTFFTDPQSLFPAGPTSYSSYIYNDIKGIGLFQTDTRERWKAIRLQHFHYIHSGHFSIWRYVMLQEFGHRWACYANYKDPNTGTTMMDHRLSWSQDHWSNELDDDKSPMDYNSYEWIDLPNEQFRQVPLPLTSDQYVYCGLDLYLMGLRNSGEIADFKILRDLLPVPGSPMDFTANPLPLRIQDFINQEGTRIPPSSESPKYWRHAFIVLTKDINQVQDFVNKVDSLRRKWKDDIIEATEGIAKIDTFLSTLFRLTHIANIVGVAGYYADNDQHQHVIVVTSNKVHELWWNLSQGEQGVLTQWHAHAIENSAFTPPHWEGILIGDTPSNIVGVAGYYTDNDQHQHVILGNTNGIVRELYWNPAEGGQVGQGDLLQFTAGNIVAVAGFYSIAEQRNVVMVGTTAGKIHEIYWKAGQQGIEGHGDLPVQFTAGSIVALDAYYNADDQRNVVMVGTTAGKIHEIYWKAGTGGIEGHGDLPVQFTAGSIVAVAGYYAVIDQRHHVIVATTDGKVHEIFFKSEQVGIEGQYVLAEFNVGSIVAVAGYYAENDKRQHIIVSTKDGNVHDFSFISHL